MQAVTIEITRTPLDLTKAMATIADPAHGAVDLFVGTVRNHHEGRDVMGITYDVHETLALKTLREICEAAAQQWPQTRYYAAHFHGELSVGGISVLIAVGSAHRGESFAACRYVIEEIKKRLPVWKQEHYAEGKSGWLPGHSLNGGVRCA